MVSPYISIALSMNLRVVTFLQPYPQIFFKTRNWGMDDALLLFQLLIADLNTAKKMETFLKTCSIFDRS